MTESNKETLIHFGKVAALGLIGFIAIITAVGVWNGIANDAIGSFYGWVAFFNLVVEGFGVWSLTRKFFPKPVKKEDGALKESK